MNKRLETLLSFVKGCGTFADIGCDHGIIAVSVLKSGICERVIAADVSKDSLNKAVKLADNEAIDGLIPVLSDGFKAICEHVDQAMIAGMGGEEIIKILSEREDLPDRLILQPMKNSEKLRRTLYFEYRYPIVNDFTFFDGDKFYDLIVCDRSESFVEYDEEELTFGKGNVSGNEDFKRYAENLYKTLLPVLEKTDDTKAKADIEKRIDRLRKYL